MREPVEWVALIASVGLVVLVIELARRRRLAEEYAVVWLVAGGGLVALAVRRELLHSVAEWLGIFYPPAVLLLVTIGLGFVVSLYFSVVASQHRREIERLAEEVALLEERLRAQEARSGAQSSEPKRPTAAS
jgi:hypothetical protein